MSVAVDAAYADDVKADADVKNVLILTPMLMLNFQCLPYGF